MSSAWARHSFWTLAAPSRYMMWSHDFLILEYHLVEKWMNTKHPRWGILYLLLAAISRQVVNWPRRHSHCRLRYPRPTYCAAEQYQKKRAILYRLRMLQRQISRLCLQHKGKSHWLVDAKAYGKQAFSSDIQHSRRGQRIAPLTGPEKSFGKRLLLSPLSRIPLGCSNCLDWSMSIATRLLLSHCSCALQDSQWNCTPTLRSLLGFDTTGWRRKECVREHDILCLESISTHYHKFTYLIIVAVCTHTTAHVPIALSTNLIGQRTQRISQVRPWS